MCRIRQFHPDNRRSQNRFVCQRCRLIHNPDANAGRFMAKRVGAKRSIVTHGASHARRRAGNSTALLTRNQETPTATATVDSWRDGFFTVLAARIEPQRSARRICAGLDVRRCEICRPCGLIPPRSTRQCDKQPGSQRDERACPPRNATTQVQVIDGHGMGQFTLHMRRQRTRETRIANHDVGLAVDQK